MSYQPPPGPGFQQQPGWNGPPQQYGPPQQFGPPTQWGEPPAPPRTRGGAPWWTVIVLGVVVVALAAGLLVVLLTGGSDGSTESVVLPDEVAGVELADEQELDREATREQILEDTGAAGDAAEYEDDGDQIAVYVVRKEAIDSYNTVPEDEDDKTYEVRSKGEVRCGIQLATDEDDEDEVVGCDRTGPDLTIQVRALGVDEDQQVRIVNELWEEFS